MKYRILIFILILTACSSGKTDRISEDVMAEIMTDLMLTDAVEKDRLSSDFFGQKDTVDFRSWAWEKHGFTKADYDSSMKFYTDNPEQLNDLYQDVIYALSVREENLPEHKKDSLLLKKDVDIVIVDGHVPAGAKLSIPISEVGRYSVRVDATVSTQDRSKSPGMRVTLDDANTVLNEDGNDDKFRVYLKDGRKRAYQVSQIYRVKEPTMLNIDMAWTKDPESLKHANFSITSVEVRLRY